MDQKVYVREHDIIAQDIQEKLEVIVDLFSDSSDVFFNHDRHV
jgi:hypothetical protein